MSSAELKMIKKYEGAIAMPVAVEEVADEDIFKPIVRKKLNPNSLISPSSVQVMDKSKKSATKMYSGRKYNYSTINEYSTPPIKKVISTKNNPLLKKST